MLKKIPSEQPDPKKMKKKGKRSQGKLQKKIDIISKEELNIINKVGVKMLKYGKKGFTTSKQFQLIIHDMQLSTLFIQKQHREFLRKQGHNKNDFTSK